MKITIRFAENRNELNRKISRALQTTLLNSADPECSPEVYKYPREAEWALMLQEIIGQIPDTEITYQKQN
jgi:hypothetical protein